MKFIVLFEALAIVLLALGVSLVVASFAPAAAAVGAGFTVAAAGCLVLLVAAQLPDVSGGG